MNITKQTKLKMIVSLSLAGSIGLMVLTSCQEPTPGVAQSGGPATKPYLLGIFPPAPEQSGAQLWSDNCARCHNMRPPQEFSPHQWAVIVHHMQLRANLTGEEARKITQFLQASS